MTLRSGDALVLQGDAEHLFQAETRLLKGLRPLQEPGTGG
jgi:hypothetical protein